VADIAGLKYLPHYLGTYLFVFFPHERGLRLRPEPNQAPVLRQMAAYAPIVHQVSGRIHVYECHWQMLSCRRYSVSRLGQAVVIKRRCTLTQEDASSVGCRECAAVHLALCSDHLIMDFYQARRDVHPKQDTRLLRPIGGLCSGSRRRSLVPERVSGDTEGGLADSQPRCAEVSTL
jgi:hypothetical protein